MGVVLAVLFFGCGRTPPAAFWTPTKDDSTAIDNVVKGNKALFRVGLSELALTMCDSTLPGTTGTKIFPKEILGNPFKQRFRMNGLQHVFNIDSNSPKYTFIATVDSVMLADSSMSTETTCTVTVGETIPGTLNMHAFKITPFLHDSMFIVGPGETLYLPFYDTVPRTCDTVISKTISAALSDGCVLKKVNGQWQLWKIGGGDRLYAPDADDAPYISYYYLDSRDRTDTITLRPDTLHYGIQRLFTFDTTGSQLLTFKQGDFLRVSKLLTNVGDAQDYLYFNGRRYEYSDTVKLDSVPTGVYRLYLEHIPVTVLWEVQGKYVATVWGVPIRVVAATEEHGQAPTDSDRRGGAR
jgi:hypothetical protein